MAKFCKAKKKNRATDGWGESVLRRVSGQESPLGRHGNTLRSTEKVPVSTAAPCWCIWWVRTWRWDVDKYTVRDALQHTGLEPHHILHQHIMFSLAWEMNEWIGMASSDESILNKSFFLHPFHDVTAKWQCWWICWMWSRCDGRTNHWRWQQHSS